MYLLIEILDGTNPREINENTQVDFHGYEHISDAIMYAEPENLDEGDFVVVDEIGEFGVVPKTSNAYIPELIDKWRNPSLSSLYFERYETLNF